VPRTISGLVVGAILIPLHVLLVVGSFKVVVSCRGV